jgi:hypothetical protein
LRILRTKVELKEAGIVLEVPVDVFVVEKSVKASGGLHYA